MTPRVWYLLCVTVVRADHELIAEEQSQVKHPAQEVAAAGAMPFDLVAGFEGRGQGDEGQQGDQQQGDGLTGGKPGLHHAHGILL